MIDLPQPVLVAAFSVLFGAAVTAVVTKIRADRAAIAAAEQIVGQGPMTLDAAKKVINTNAVLQRTVEALQTCNDGLEAELRDVKATLEETKGALTAALSRICDLEDAIRVMRTVRDNKRQRIADANRDVTT